MGEKIDNRIKEHRLQNELTQEELGQAVGVSRQSINAIERGRYIPSLPLALKFARYFKRPIEELFTLQEEDE
ncbi:MAG: helix-turn-helix transcriptional regulator [Anaerolineales bacterium]|jgi:putative transcriptional regulator